MLSYVMIFHVYVFFSLIIIRDHIAFHVNSKIIIIFCYQFSIILPPFIFSVESYPFYLTSGRIFHLLFLINIRLLSFLFLLDSLLNSFFSLMRVLVMYVPQLERTKVCVEGIFQVSCDEHSCMCKGAEFIYKRECLTRWVDSK